MKHVKKIAIGITGIALTVSLTACGGHSNPPKNTVGQNVTSVNGIQKQNEVETISAYNKALKNIENQYPASQINPLELKMLRERNLYLSDESNVLYMYIFPTGRNEVFFSTVRGKVSSMTSQQTATDGIFNNKYDGGTQAIPIPQDDLSYGGSEFGDQGIFWFDMQGGFHEAGTAGATVMIESSPLDLKTITLKAQPMDPKILSQMKHN